MNWLLVLGNLDGNTFAWTGLIELTNCFMPGYKLFYAWIVITAQVFLHKLSVGDVNGTLYRDDDLHV
jgi:hypothetical protein